MKQTLEEYMAEHYTGIEDFEINNDYNNKLNRDNTVRIECTMYTASAVLKEINPEAYRRGLADHFSSWTEVAGLYYENEDIESAKSEYEDEGIEEQLNHEG